MSSPTWERPEGAHALDEIAPVARRLEPHEVVLQKRHEDFQAPRQFHENVEGRERRMQEKARSAFHPHLAQLTRGENKVIVLYPDIVFPLGLLGDHLGELAVHHLVHRPVPGVEVAVRNQVVKQGPEYLVGKAVVVIVQFLVGKADRYQGIPGLPSRLRQQSV